MNDIIVSSDENEDFMEHQKNYDKNAGNIINKDDAWYYNDKKFVTNTHLGKILKGGPQHLKAYYDHGQKETDALIFGRAQHCLLFEPDMFAGRFYAIDDAEICVEASGKNWKKEGKNPRATKIYKTWLAELKEKNSHRQELSMEDMVSINDMIDKALSYKQVRELVESAHLREKIYSKTMKGIDCKIKVDSINPSNYILDYKSTKDPATLFNWPRIKNSYRYDRQASFYKDVSGVQSFWWIVQEKKFPYTVCLIEQSAPSYDEGVKEYELGLEMYRKHFIDGNPADIDNYLEMGML